MRITISERNITRLFVSVDWSKQETLDFSSKTFLPTYLLTYYCFPTGERVKGILSIPQQFCTRVSGASKTRNRFRYYLSLFYRRSLSNKFSVWDYQTTNADTRLVKH